MIGKKTVYIKDNEWGDVYKLELSNESIKFLEWLKSEKLLSEEVDYKVGEVPMVIKDIAL